MLLLLQLLADSIQLSEPEAQSFCLAVIAGPWLALDVLYVWSAMIADWTVRMALLLWRYRSERWKAIQVIR